MKMVAKYLENARKFERMAAEELNPEVKLQFEKQAAACRKLAVERAKKLGLPQPKDTREAFPRTIRMHFADPAATVTAPTAHANRSAPA
jgi:hypothetical protein